MGLCSTEEIFPKYDLLCVYIYIHMFFSGCGFVIREGERTVFIFKFSGQKIGA